MNDPEIRKVLISFLETQGSELRIYNEKTIGRVVCDVMFVSDELVGYEIKSDRDSYRRLKRQIKAYDAYFDRNYIVVGASHAKSVADKVPKHWGIICIAGDNIDVKRIAEKSPKCLRRFQLYLLWRVELRNILIENKMPLYSSQNKIYAVSRILESVDPELLGKQIAYQLLHRDYSRFERR